MITLTKDMSVDMSNQKFGVSTHERRHLEDALERYLARTIAIIEEELPEGGSG